MTNTLRMWWAWLLLFVGSAAGYAETQWLDVVHLREGTSLRGVIVEQVAGESVRLATSDQTALTLRQREIDFIEKVETEKALALSFTDVAILKDGVIFRGLLVEQRPEESLVLRTNNGLLLEFPMADIWKIVKEKHLVGVLQEEAASTDRLGTIKLLLRIERGAKALQEKRSADQPGGLKEQIEEVKEELGELERVQAEAEQELASEQQGSERERIEQTCRQVEESLQELEQGLEECRKVSARTEAQAMLNAQPKLVGTQASQGRLGPSAQKLQEGLTELESRIAVKLPNEEEIRTLEDAQQARARLGAWLADGEWRKPFYKPRARALAQKLPIDERQFLYGAYAKHTGWLGFGLNAIPALQLGSWAQGDWLGALFGYAHFIGGISGGVIVYQALNPDNPYIDQLSDLSTAVVLQSAIPFFLSYVVSLLQPLYYQSRWNQRLADVLQLPEGTRKRKPVRADLPPPLVAVLRTPEHGIVVNVCLFSLSY